MPRNKTNRLIFPQHFYLGETPEGAPCLVIAIGSMAIHDPFLSTCGRFEVDPEVEHGIPDDLARAIGIVNLHLERYRDLAESTEAKLAVAFCGLLRDTLGNDLAEVVSRNDQEENPNVCHSHDFCDANMVMDQAMTDLGLATLPEDERLALFTKAWAIAKDSDFDLEIAR